MGEVTLAALYGAAATILVGLLGWAGIRATNRQAKSATEQATTIQQARDTSGDYNNLIDQLQEEVEGLRADVGNLLARIESSERRAFEAEAARFAAESARLDDRRAMGAHVAALQHQIYTGKPPPPVGPPLPY